MSLNNMIHALSNVNINESVQDAKVEPIGGFSKILDFLEGTGLEVKEDKAQNALRIKDPEKMITSRSVEMSIYKAPDVDLFDVHVLSMRSGEHFSELQSVDISAVLAEISYAFSIANS